MSYWCRLYGLQTGLKLSSKQREETELLIGKLSTQFLCKHRNELLLIVFKFGLFAAIMTWLESFKVLHHDNEAITNEIVAQAHLENYALKLFTYADQQDRAGAANK